MNHSFADFEHQFKCPHHSHCVNNRGSYKCSCDEGFSEDTSVTHTDHDVTCIDDDECAVPNDCDSNADCTNLPGSYKCKCKSGFESPEMMGYHCVDIDECSG